eukprot:4438444-Amphidinium_carterae.1
MRNADANGHDNISSRIALGGDVMVTESRTVIASSHANTYGTIIASTTKNTARNPLTNVQNPAAHATNMTNKRNKAQESLQPCT